MDNAGSSEGRMDRMGTKNETTGDVCIQRDLFALIRQMADAGESEGAIRALTGASYRDIRAALEQDSDSGCGL